MSNDPNAPAPSEPVAPVLALPAPEPRKAYRILALTESGVPLTRAFARTVQALRDAGSEVVPLPIPRGAAASAESIPSIAELKRGISSFAKDLVRGLRGGEVPQAEPWVVSQLKAVEGRIDAVLATDAEVAKIAFPWVDRAFPGALRVALDTDYHLDPEWKSVELDALVIAHPGVGADLARISEGRARTFIGGPVAAGAEMAPRRLDDSRPQVTVSFSRLEPGDVDSLLFQLSLAKPERFSLLFLPSSRPGVDELVRARAATYGLRGKRPKEGAELEAWIRGSSILVGFPSPAEAATAVAAGVPMLFVASEGRLQGGDRFLLQRGAALLSDVPITIAVHVEGLLPGGTYRDKVELALRDLEPTGTGGAAQAVLAAIEAGRPAPAVAPAGTTSQVGTPVDDDLEDIGETRPSAPGAATELSLPVRRAYLKEIILHQHHLERNLARAKGGLETWQRRVRLARTAGQDVLADQAVPRVEGLLKVIDQLERELREVQGLRERFASTAPLSAADRAAAARFMSPGTAASLDRNDAPESAFTQLELEDALAVLKRKLEGR